jgi:cytochrome c553
MNILCRISVACLVVVAYAPGAPAANAAADADIDADVEFFEKSVRPLLTKHCYECHSEKAEEVKGGLLLDSRDGWQAGGDSGPAIVPGKPEESLLLSAIGYDDPELQMPPEKQLSDAEIAALRRWIERGAVDPRDGKKSVKPRRGKIDITAGRKFWAFIPPRDPPAPQVKSRDWPVSSLDRFVLAKLESKGIKPAPPADKRTLIRRATFDLIGLPPTPKEIAAFLSDDSPRAFERVVERLLSSPHYGERWGRHWLDVARYADSNGLDENVAHGNAWRYRDWVVASMNRDKPYNEFLIEQLAGDLLPAVNDIKIRHDRLIATGFLSLGPKVLAEVDERKMEMDIVDEQIETVGRAFMGLTLGCARCHDHKFDPVTSDDYYALAGIFKSTKTMDSFTKIAVWHEHPLETGEYRKLRDEHQKTIARRKQDIERLTQKATGPENTAAELKRLRDELAKLEKSPPAVPTAMGAIEGKIANVRRHLRGSHLTLGDTIPRGVPRVLTSDGTLVIDPKHSGRLELARWLASGDHPLTARVMVNRIWRWHFGRGLVASCDNFGMLGGRPVNGPLLDWLAVRFVRSGWSIKKMHRLIMLSATYRMSSTHDAASARIDPENLLQWRASVRRLEAEAIRDAVLAASGRLDRTMGGSLLHVKNREFFFDHTSKDGTKYDSLRRSIYLPVVRNHLYGLFELFDFPDSATVHGSRATTTVAPQSLSLTNSPLVWESAAHWAAGLLKGEKSSDADRIGKLYVTAFGRPTTKKEIARAEKFLRGYAESITPHESDPKKRTTEAWQALCRAMIASNEFIYVR